MKVISLAFIAVLSFSSGAFALGGNLEFKDDSGKAEENWIPDSPKIVVALGLLTSKQDRRYIKELEKQVKDAPEDYPHFLFLHDADGARIVRELRDPNTIGLILISHAFKTKQMGSAPMVDSKRQVLPTELLSAATPSLRFVAFLGCYGPNVIRHFQTKFELDRIRGKQRVYYTTDKYLAAGLLWIDGVRNALRKTFDNVHEDGLLEQGMFIKPEATATLKVSVQGVNSRMQARYVYVNGRITGTLNSQSRGNQGPETQEFVFSEGILKESGCQKISIRGPDLSPQTPSDEFTVNAVTLQMGGKFNEKIFSEPVKIGGISKQKTFAICI